MFIKEDTGLYDLNAGMVFDEIATSLNSRKSASNSPQKDPEENKMDDLNEFIDDPQNTKEIKKSKEAA